MRRKTSFELNKLRRVYFENEMYYFSVRYPVFAVSKKLRMIHVKKNRDDGETCVHHVNSDSDTPLTWIDDTGSANRIFKSRVIADIFMFNDDTGFLTDELPRKWAKGIKHADELPEDHEVACLNRTKWYKFFDHDHGGEWLTAMQVAMVIFKETDVTSEEFRNQFKKLRATVNTSRLRARASGSKKIRVYGHDLLVRD